jgi:glycosyltransferase involved in cell wall biosynthesis
VVGLPLVSVGLPVYNAARYLKEALDSLLSQDYRNLELIVSDNASNDATQEICNGYVRRDSRVNYQRNARNMGAVWNFNRVLELARGEYFMWAAHDDLREPTYISACLTALRARPEAVLCCTGIRFIDEDSRPIQEPASVVGIRPVGETARERLRQVVRAVHWTDVYSLARTDALRKTRGAISAWGFDVIVQLELCLRGPVVLVPEPLFTYRRYRVKTFQELASGLDTAGGVTVNWSGMAVEMLRAVWLAPYSVPTRLVLVASFLMNCCVLNHYLGNAIRSDLTRNLRTALQQKRIRRLASLLLIGTFVYPVYNRLGRALYRLIRPPGRQIRNVRTEPSSSNR